MLGSVLQQTIIDPLLLIPSYYSTSIDMSFYWDLLDVDVNNYLDPGNINMIMLAGMGGASVTIPNDNTTDPVNVILSDYSASILPGSNPEGPYLVADVERFLGGQGYWTSKTLLRVNDKCALRSSLTCYGLYCYSGPFPDPLGATISFTYSPLGIQSDNGDRDTVATKTLTLRAAPLPEISTKILEQSVVALEDAKAKNPEKREVSHTGL